MGDNTSTRNYSLDFYKLIFALLICLCHSTGFVLESTTFVFPPNLGFIGVHFFFIVSGILMTDQLHKRTIEEKHEKYAFDFVVNKAKKLYPQLFAALLICIIGMFVFYNHKNLLPDFWQKLPKVFAEVFLVHNYSFVLFNGPTWYISIMLLTMLPLSYLMVKRFDLTVYIISPLVAILIFGEMLTSKEGFSEISTNGFIRSVMGLCFGAVSWIICSYISRLKDTVKVKLIATVSELLCYGLFFIILFSDNVDYQTIMSISLLLVVGIAITYSRKSYIADIFSASFWKFLGPLSLAIYLNHWTAKRTVEVFMPGKGLKNSIMLMMAFTLVYSALSWIIVKFVKYIYKKSKDET